VAASGTPGVSMGTMFKLEFSWQNLAFLTGIYIVYLLVEAVYRITLHPLAKFPGPFLASITYKYEWYYDGLGGGQYTAEIARMHEEYGMFPRIVYPVMSLIETFDRSHSAHQS
jgi:hypothetical protein